MKQKYPNGNVIKLIWENSEYGFVMADGIKESIATNPIHVGYEYKELVYCNIYPMGKPLNDWINSFHAVGYLKVYRNDEEIIPDAAGIYH